MTTDDIRRKFLDFFASKGHTIVESDSLVPKDDPTVLFTTAGMQQFKRQFLGHIDEYKRATTSQKCLRTDDLDEVGKTDFHHTFFEMLGNFSFGDYFKKEAIEWGWEFLTKELGIKPDELWVTVYNEDTEAKEIWENNIKELDPKKIIPLGDHTNFWPADAKKNGPNGPCGPCSEIFYDYGINEHCLKDKCDPSCDCGRFSEIWNLVFTQFNRKDGGKLEPLPNKNIDTGMGLERLAAVKQIKNSNYEIDIFTPILTAIDKEVNPSNNLAQSERYIIADHIRSVVFGINDGVVPSNEERGYVIKKLIINMTDIAIRAGAKSTNIHKLVGSVVEAMKNPYPELEKKSKDISAIIKNIEQSYLKVCKEKLPIFEKESKDICQSGISKDEKQDKLGNLIFTYKDTHGLTIPTIEKIITKLAELDLIDAKSREAAWQKFNELMATQQKQSRSKSKMTGDVFTDTSLDLGLPKTKFLGYDHTHSTSTALKLFIKNKKVNEVTQGDQIKIVLDKSPFYAESGGQVSDSGSISNQDGRILVSDTHKIDDIYIHSGIVESGAFQTDKVVQAEIDVERRMAIMRNHTATHLLQAALRDVLGTHVGQQGSLVAEDRLRFDFTHHKPISDEELMKIEARVNDMILSCETITKEFLDIEQARKSGALAFFAEKYGKVVRIVSIGNYSKEFCGGTHLDNTGQIGIFKITSESAIAQGIRRLEAKTGLGALDYIHGQQTQLKKISKILKSSSEDLIVRIEQQTKRLKAMEKELSESQFASIKNSIDKILESSEKIKGTTFISHCFKNIEMDLLRKISDLIKQKAKSSIIVLGAHADQNASILIAVTDDLIKKGYKANELIKDIAPLIDGKGGGRPQLAQAGSKNADKVSQAIKKANSIIKEKIEK